MASSFVSQSASFVLFVDNVRVGTLENRVRISLKIPYVAVPVPVLPIFFEDGLNLQIANSTSNRDEVLIVFVIIINFIDNNIQCIFVLRTCLK